MSRQKKSRERGKVSFQHPRNRELATGGSDIDSGADLELQDTYFLAPLNNSGRDCSRERVINWILRRRELWTERNATLYPSIDFNAFWITHHHSKKVAGWENTCLDFKESKDLSKRRNYWIPRQVERRFRGGFTKFSSAQWYDFFIRHPRSNRMVVWSVKLHCSNWDTTFCVSVQSQVSKYMQPVWTNFGSTAFLSRNEVKHFVPWDCGHFASICPEHTSPSNRMLEFCHSSLDRLSLQSSLKNICTVSKVSFYRVKGCLPEFLLNLRAWRAP